LAGTEFKTLEQVMLFITQSTLKTIINWLRFTISG